MGSNTGIEPVSTEPQSVMLASTPKAPCVVGRPRFELGLPVYQTSSLNRLADLPKCVDGMRLELISSDFKDRHTLPLYDPSVL